MEEGPCSAPNGSEVPRVSREILALLFIAMAGYGSFTHDCPIRVQSYCAFEEILISSILPSNQNG